MNYKLFIAFFLFIGAINAVPTKNYSERTATCSSKCLNHENNLFEIGSTHHFNYETKSEIELENGQRTQVHLRAKVDIATISKCEHQLQLRKVQVDGPNGSEILKKQLEQYSTKFSQDNGRIESICFDEEELDWVLNLKKSILSTIQVSEREQNEQTIVEKDILGYCSTKYEKISSNQIQKTKYLGTCTKRRSVNSILIGDFGKQKKSTCKIELDNQKQLNSIICEEENTMLPFAQSKASGQIKTTTKLTLDKIEKTLPLLNNKQLIKDSLTFDKNQLNRHNEQESREIVQEIEKILNEIRSDVENNIQKETPEKIRKLSQHLSFLNVQELERLAQQVSNKNDKVQDIFFDTVAQTGTQETAHIILKVILDKQYYKGEISKVRSALWLSMLSNVDQVTDDVLSIVSEHIKKDNLPRQALFALTSMVNEIKDDEEIKQDSRYKQIVNDLIEKLNRSNDEKEKIVILKALQNTGLHNEVFENVLQIAQKQSYKVETRIAAVQALEEQVNEEDRFYKKVLKIFENSSNEAELRIAAFQVLVNDQEKVRELYNVFKTESNKQVGSYVVSYFKNARKSQLNEYETLRRIVSTFDLPEKRFEREDFRQSKHVQFTQQIDSLDLNTQIEADLIFDEQKQLRNVRARFDLNKENEQIKSVEVTVRQTGLPELAQQMVQQLTKQINLNQIVEEVKQFTTIRSKHELNTKINRLVQLLNLNKIDLNSRKLSEEVDASIHVKLEDKTVLYLNIKDIQEYTRKLERQYNQREQIVNQIIEQLSGDNALTLILSNKQHRLPTANGLPLHSARGIVIVAGLKNQKDDLTFYPSIALDAHYEMGFTIMNERPSVHYHLQIHSAPGLKVNVERKNGLPAKLSISIPDDRLQIISVRSIVKLQTPTEEVELNVSKNQRKSCTKLFNKILGVELCYQTTYPRNLIEKNALNVLLNGQYEFALHLEKTDSSIKHWEINFETPYNQRSGQPKVLYVALKTVGSRTEREISAKIELQNERDSKILHIDLKSPVKSAKIEGRAQWNEQNIGLKAALIMDGQRYEAQIGGEKVNENGEQEYRPIVKLVIPGFRKIHYTGKVAFVNTASAIKSGIFDAKENFKVATDVQAFWFTGTSIRFVSNVDKNSNGLSSAIEVIHSSDRQAPTTYKWKIALNDLSQNKVQKYNADFELNVPQTDFENVAISWNFVRKIDQEIETELTAFWNNEQNQKTRQVHILQQLKMNKVSAKISSLFENLLKVEIKPLSVHYELQAKTNWQRTQQKYNVQLNARDIYTNKQYKGDMIYQLSQQAPLKMELEAKIQIENNEFKIQHKIDEQEKQQYHGRTLVQLRKGQHIEFNYVYRLKEHSLQVPRLNHELELEAKIPSKQITIKHKSGLKLNSDQFELKHSLRKNNAVVSDVKVLINRKGQSQLLTDNPLFQVKADGDLSQQDKQINVLLTGKQYQFTHQTKLNFNGKQQLKVDSKTTKNNRQVANVQVHYLRNQKAEAKVEIEKIGDLRIKHEPNSQQLVIVEINSDYYSKPINQQFIIEKNSNKYTIRSKTQQNQQVIGDLDLEIGSTSTLKVSAFDWKVSGRAQGKEKINFVLENNRNVREELELQLNRQNVRIGFKHLDNQKHLSTLSGQLSITEESQLQFNNKNKDVKLSIKPVGQQKHIKIEYNDKRNNIQHKSELKSQDSALVIVLEHSQDNQNVIKHYTKLSRDDDSYTKTETKKILIEANYRRKQALDIKFNHENGLSHQTSLEIIDLRNKVAKISSSTNKNGKQIMNINVDIDSWKKIDTQIAYLKQEHEKEIKLRMNLKDQQKHITLQTRCPNFEINSKWNKESQKDHKLTIEILDKKHDSKHNLLAHHQRKTMLNIKVESLRNGKHHNGELKLHRNGEAYLKINGQDLKLDTKLDFAHSPVKATVSFENKKNSIQHETTATFLQQENELKIKSKTNENSKQIVNVDFKINPTTKQIFASGELYNKNLKIEGAVNKRFTIELQNQDEQFKHLTELDLNQRTLRSETSKNNQKLHKLNIEIVNRRDIQGSLEIKEHEIIVKSNENNNQYELHYNNKKLQIISTGYYTISQHLVAAKINAKLESRQIIDLDANLRFNERKFDGRLVSSKTKSLLKFDFSQRRQLKANAQFENQEKNQLVQFSIDTTESEKKIAAKVVTKNLKIEKEIKLVNGKELRFDGQLEQNGQSVKANAKISKPFNIEGKVHFNTRNLKGQASVETVNDNEIKIQLVAKDSQERKVADLKSKLKKSNNKVSVNVDFDSQTLNPYTLVGELRKESEQLVLSSLIKSKEQKVGKFDARIRVSGWTVDAKVDGDLTINGKRKEIFYKLNNLNNKFEHILKIKKENYSHGYEISVHLKQGKFVIHLPNRIVEFRYDVTTQTNGHVVITLDVLPDSQHQPNNIYNVKFDNLITMNNQELILNTRTTVHHPHINHPIDMQFRVEVREPSHQRPFVIFVSYDASSNQQNRVSALFEINNEQHVRVAHFNISHQNQQIVDIHYRFAMNTHLVHQQLKWSILNQNTQKVTGELLGQVNLKQRNAKIELNNKHKLQINWEENFDKKVIIQIRAQTENLVRKVKIVSNNQQIEITNYENEKIKSNYIVSVLKVENTLLAVEMHKKQNGKSEKVAFIQLVKDSLNYAKVHLKVEKSLVYEIQNSVKHVENKVKSIVKRHEKEIKQIVRQQYHNMKLNEQTENTSKLIKKASEDLKNVANDYQRLLQKYLPNILDSVDKVYKKISQYFKQTWNVNLEEIINEIISELSEKINQVERKLQHLIRKVEEESRKIKRQLSEIKEKYDHEVVAKLSEKLEQNLKDAIQFAEREGEKVYELLDKVSKNLRVNDFVRKIRSIVVEIKNQIKQTKVHDNLHNLIYNYQSKFQGKWQPKEGEVIAKIYFPTTLLNKWSN